MPRPLDESDSPIPTSYNPPDAQAIIQDQASGLDHLTSDMYPGSGTMPPRLAPGEDD